MGTARTRAAKKASQLISLSSEDEAQPQRQQSDVLPRPPPVKDLRSKIGGGKGAPIPPRPIEQTATLSVPPGGLVIRPLVEFAPPLAVASGAVGAGAAAAAAPAPSGVVAKKRKRKRKRAKVGEAPQPAEAPALRAPDSGAHGSAQPTAVAGPDVWLKKKDKRRVDWMEKVEELERLKKEKAERVKREAEAEGQRGGEGGTCEGGA